MRADQGIRCGGTEAEEEGNAKDYPGLALHTGDPDDRLRPDGRVPLVWVPDISRHTGRNAMPERTWKSLEMGNPHPRKWWALLGSNQRPPPCEDGALTI